MLALRHLPRVVLAYIESFFVSAPVQPPDLWAEASVYMPKKVSPGNEGPFRFRLVSWTRSIIRASAAPDCRVITFICGTQSAKTTVATVITLYKAIVERINVVWMWPKHSAGRSFCLSRFKPVIEASPPLAAFRPANDDLYKNDEIHFAGAGVVNFVGSHSAVDAKSRPAGLVVTDEVDDIYLGNESDSDPITNLAERGKTILGALQVRIGSPTIETRPAWRNWLVGDQRHDFIACPHCHTWQTLEDCGPVFVLENVPPDPLSLPPDDFAATVTVRQTGRADDWHLRWDPEAKLGENQWDYARVAATARYHCVSCDVAWTQTDKDDAIRAQQDRWVPTVKAKEPGAYSFRLPALYPSWPGTSFAENAKFFLKSRLSAQDRQSYENNWRARPFARGHDTTDRTKLSALVEMIAGPHCLGERVGARTVLLVDVQRHYVIWSLWGFDAAGAVHLINVNTARDLDAIGVLDEELKPDFGGMDSRHRSQEVYAFVHQRRSRWFALRGDDSGSPLKPVYNFDPFTGEKNQGIFQITLLHLHTYVWGEELLARLYPPADESDQLPDFEKWKTNRPAPTDAAAQPSVVGPRIKDLFLPRDMVAKAASFTAQLYNEYIIEYYDARGNLVRKWTERKNNHLFDLAKYAMALGSFLGFTRKGVEAAKAAADAAAKVPAGPELDLTTPQGGTKLFG